MPLRQPQHDHGDDGNKNEDFKNRGDSPHHLNAANVDPSNDGDQSEGSEPVFPSDNLREVESQVVGEQYGVGAAKQE